VFQDASLDLELTVMETMLLHAVLYKVPANRRKDGARDLLNSLGLWDRRDDLVKRLSGGMRRRLEIARTLLHTPKVIFLDEPTLGLDPQARKHLWSHIEAINREHGITVMLTTHYIEEAERAARRVAIINEGEIVACGSPFDLREKTATSSLEAAFLKLTSVKLSDL
jgi:ABC-2 type transport system ATP-binding protein